MLKLSITGPPGSAHREIGYTIANRLSLKYFAASNIAQELCKHTDIPYHIYKGHTEKSLDASVTNTLIDAERSGDYILCDTLFTFSMKESIRILIMQDLLADKPKAPGLYDETLREQALTDNDHIFTPGDYDIVLHQFYMSVNDCVKTILDCLADGIKTITYIHPYQVLPLHPSIVPESIPKYLNTKRVFHVSHYGFAYYLSDPDEYADYITYLQYGKLMSVVSIEERPTKQDLAAVKDYTWLQRLVSPAIFDNLVFGHMLSRYGAAYEVLDINQVYLDLSKNSNPYKRLREEGFDR